MAYKKIGWKNYPSTETPISATNLEHMDAGILENDQVIGDMEKVKEIGDGTLAGAIQVLNEGMLNIDTISVEINAIESEGNIGKCYGTKVLNLSKYSNIKAVTPISAVHKTSPGTVGVLGKYSYSTPTGESVWALSAPIVGTYVCDFLVLYADK